MSETDFVSFIRIAYTMPAVLDDHPHVDRKTSEDKRSTDFSMLPVLFNHCTDFSEAKQECFPDSFIAVGDA